MRANNSIHLTTAAKQRHEYTRAKALAAMHELDRAGAVLSFESVARHAECPAPGSTPKPPSKTRSADSATRANTNPALRYPPDTAPATIPYANVLNSPTAATANLPTRTSGRAASLPTPSANSATMNGSQPAEPTIAIR